MTKRWLDVVFVLATSVITVPVTLILAVVVALDGANPFFFQPRVGRGGSLYRMLKLRTMVSDAPLRLDAYLKQNPEAAAEWRVTQKLRRDPRVTWFGRFLRKTSLDELPQLWNVLCGQMSIVGPRPMMEHQRELYPGTDYYDLRPGITGPWQISTRNESEFASRAKHDTEYAHTMSFRTDLRILLGTFGPVLKGTGC